MLSSGVDRAGRPFRGRPVSSWVCGVVAAGSQPGPDLPAPAVCRVGAWQEAEHRVPARAHRRQARVQARVGRRQPEPHAKGIVGLGPLFGLPKENAEHRIEIGQIRARLQELQTALDPRLEAACGDCPMGRGQGGDPRVGRGQVLGPRQHLGRAVMAAFGKEQESLPDSRFCLREGSPGLRRALRPFRLGEHEVCENLLEGGRGISHGPPGSVEGATRRVTRRV